MGAALTPPSHPGREAWTQPPSTPSRWRDHGLWTHRRTAAFPGKAWPRADCGAARGQAASAKHRAAFQDALHVSRKRQVPLCCPPDGKVGTGTPSSHARGKRPEPAGFSLPRPSCGGAARGPRPQIRRLRPPHLPREQGRSVSPGICQKPPAGWAGTARPSWLNSRLIDHHGSLQHQHRSHWFLGAEASGGTPENSVPGVQAKLPESHPDLLSVSAGRGRGLGCGPRFSCQGGRGSCCKPAALRGEDTVLISTEKRGAAASPPRHAGSPGAEEPPRRPAPSRPIRSQLRQAGAALSRCRHTSLGPPISLF